jgi:hypothetical protein
MLEDGVADGMTAGINRGLNPFHSFLTSFFTGLAELGLVNQGSINTVVRRAAEYLDAYLEAKENLPDMDMVPGDTPMEIVKNIISYNNKILNVMGGYELQDLGNGQEALLIEGKTCRICPQGGGGALFKGTFCPIPNFLECLINNIAGKDLVKLVTEGIEKEDSTCKACFKVIS